MTGAAGLIGCAVATRLATDGPVLGTVRASGQVFPFETTALDLQLRSLVDLQRLDPMAVVHCAASIPAPPDRPDDVAAARITRDIDARVIDACSALGWRLIYVSSCILYDPTSPAIKDERTPVRATTPYAESKLIGERAAADLAGSVVMRIPSPVGDRMRKSTVLPRFVASAVRGDSLKVWGGGEREQDFIDVTDVAEFVSLVLRSEVAGTFNVASGRPVTMRRLADRVVNVIGSGSVVASDRSDPLEGATARYSTALARERVGWSAQHDLESMIRRVAASPELR